MLRPGGIRLAVGAMVVALSNSPALSAQVDCAITDFATIEDESGNSRLLFHWTPTIEAEHFVIGRAILTFDLTGAAEARSIRLSLYPVTSAWDAATVDWSTGWRTPGGDFDENVRQGTEIDLDRGGGPVGWDGTGLLKESLDVSRASHGFLITADPADGVGLRSEDAARDSAEAIR